MSRIFTSTIFPTPISCEIEVRNGVLQEIEPLAKQLAPLASKFAIITDDQVASLYGIPLQKSLADAGLDVSLCVFLQGEKQKTRNTKELIENQLFEQGFGRDSCILALGGGVVTDLAGYVAATYCRGIPLIMMPTSLLGMVDASIGGKTGINLFHGKNRIGCIYQPKKILIDPSLLISLPKKELINGVVEMVKHGLIASSALFESLERHCTQILSIDLQVIEQCILDNCLIKKEIVEQDEKETGKRHLLNFGHTVGHALEQCTHYALSHGEAIAIGLLTESHLALQLGHLHPHTLQRIHSLLIQYKLPLHLPFIPSVESLLKSMALDKKSRNQQPHFVILRDIGSVLPCNSHYCTPVEQTIVKNALAWMRDDLCRH